MFNESEISVSAASTLQRIVPKVNERTWIIEYLYQHRVGDKLPRGKSFSNFRKIENKINWLSYVTNNHSLVSFEFSKRISPYLLSQLTLLRTATIYNHCQLNTEVVFDVIKLLEGFGNVAPSTKLIKMSGSYSGGSILNNYEHVHVPMLPNSYMKMMKKEKNIDRIVKHYVSENNIVDFGKVEQDILASGKKKGARLTGHLLISQIKNGKRYYLAVFPHDYCYKLIHKQLLESEKLLDFSC